MIRSDNKSGYPGMGVRMNIRTGSLYLWVTLRGKRRTAVSVRKHTGPGAVAVAIAIRTAQGLEVPNEDPETIYRNLVENKAAAIKEKQRRRRELLTAKGRGGELPAID